MPLANERRNTCNQKVNYTVLRRVLLPSRPELSTVVTSLVRDGSYDDLVVFGSLGEAASLAKLAKVQHVSESFAIEDNITTSAQNDRRKSKQA